jgi:hypothetical protein
MFTELSTAIMAVISLPDEYMDSGVYNGNWHGGGRAFLCVVLISLGGLLIRLGNQIGMKLTAASAAVAPSSGETTSNNREKVSPEQIKIGTMVKKMAAIIGIVILYFFYDIHSSIGNYRHVFPPFCEPKNLFVRLPTFVQLYIVLMIIWAFPVRSYGDGNTKGGSMKGSTLSLFLPLLSMSAQAQAVAKSKYKTR